MQAYSSSSCAWICNVVLIIHPPLSLFLVKCFHSVLVYEVQMFFFLFSEKSINKLFSQTIVLCLAFLFGLGSSHRSKKKNLLCAERLPSLLIRSMCLGSSGRRIGNDLKCHQVKSFCSELKCSLTARKCQHHLERPFIFESLAFIQNRFNPPQVLL